MLNAWLRLSDITESGMFVTIVGSVLNCRKAILYFHAPFNLCKSSAKRKQTVVDFSQPERTPKQWVMVDPLRCAIADILQDWPRYIGGLLFVSHIHCTLLYFSLSTIGSSQANTFANCTTQTHLDRKDQQ